MHTYDVDIICICIYMCVRVYVYMCICVYVYMCICISVYLYICIYVYMYICICICIWSMSKDSPHTWLQRSLNVCYFREECQPPWRLRHVISLTPCHWQTKYFVFFSRCGFLHDPVHSAGPIVDSLLWNVTWDMGQGTLDKGQGTNPEARIQNPEARIQNPEARIQNPEARIQNPESRS